MASLESLQSRALAAQSFSGYVVDDKCVPLEIVYKGSGVVTSVTVQSATDIVLISVETAGTITVTSTFADSTPDSATRGETLGAVVDVINASPYWSARIIDGFRSTTTASSVLLPNSAVTAVAERGELVYKLFLDGSAADAMLYRVSADRGVLNDDFGRVKSQIPDRMGIPGGKQGAHRVKVNQIKYKLDLDADTVNGVRIYEVDSISGAATLIWSAIAIDDTITEHDFGVFPITAKEGNDLVVGVIVGTLADKATNYLQVDYTRE